MFRQPTKTRFPDSPAKALEYALRILNMKWYGQEEMAKKLRQKGFDESTVATTLQELGRLGYVNDDRLLENLVTQYRDFGTYGRVYIRQKLLQKNFDKEKISLALEEFFSKDEELEAAKRFLQKQKLQVEDDFKAKQKLLAKFLRRGFSFEIAKQVINGPQIHEPAPTEASGLHE
jgi:regulatory protein